MTQDRTVDVSSDEGDTGGWLRERDHEQPVELWDERSGEMTKLRKKPPSARAQADAMVAAALGHIHDQVVTNRDESDEP